MVKSASGGQGACNYALPPRVDPRGSASSAVARRADSHISQPPEQNNAGVILRREDDNVTRKVQACGVRAEQL